MPDEWRGRRCGRANGRRVSESQQSCGFRERYNDTIREPDALGTFAQLGYSRAMLDFVMIESIARRLASEKLGTPAFERLVARSATDSEGREALRITLVLSPEAATELSGDEALDLLTELNHALEREGEERFAVVEYATEAEMQEDEEHVLGLQEERGSTEDES